MTMSKPILFCDFHGVISYNFYWKSLQNPQHYLHIYHQAIIVNCLDTNNNILQSWMIGDLTTEQVHVILHQKTGVPYQDLMDIFVDECRNIDIFEAFLAKIRSVKDKYFTILATGNMDSFDRFTLPYNSILQNTFDRIDNSYNIGILKTSNNGEYFVNTIQEFAVDTKSCVLIDDSQETCKTFDNLGGKSYLITSRESAMEVFDQL